MLDATNPQNILQVRALHDKVLFNEVEEEDEEAITYNKLVDEFGDEAVGLTNYYLHRYKLFKLVPQELVLETDDVFVFCLIEEEVGNREAAERAKMEQKHGN